MKAGMRYWAPFDPYRALADGVPDDVALADFPVKERILVVVAQQLLASTSNIAARLDVSNSDIYKACAELEKENLITGGEFGLTRRSQRRYVLTRQGVMHVTQPFQYRGLVRAALPLTWQMTEEGVKRMLHWLPMIESLYEVLPTFWTGGLAAPFQWQSTYPDPSCSSYVWLGIPTLMEVCWLPSGRLHAVAIWRFERLGKRPTYRAVPFLWSGLLPQEDYRSRSLRLGSEYIRCPRNPEDEILWDIEPQAVVIGADTFAAFRARTAYGDDVQVGSVDTAGALVWCAGASHSEWTLRDKPPQARSIGHPEAAIIEEGPDLVNLGGIREYRLFNFICEFRAATKAHLGTAFQMARGAVNTVIDRLTERGLIKSADGHLYCTRRGLEMLAARDRVDVGRLVEVTYLDPNGEDAKRERRHDSAVAAAAAAFWGAGIPVVAGWRWVVSWKDGQLVPDLWSQLPVPGREDGTWVAVELEFSAKTEKRIAAGKLRSYRLAPIRLNKTFPLLVITGEALAAQRFDELAGDLPMLTTTLREFLTGVWEGLDSVWRRKGRTVGLSDIAGEHQDHLRQKTGRSLDHTAPSLEVWGKLVSQEFLWSEAQIYGYGMAILPSDPKLLAELQPEPTEAQTELSATKPVSAPKPPTPAPAPVREAPTAEDLARLQLQELREINWLVSRAYEIATSRMRDRNLDIAERLCLRRVQVIISYGANQHNQADEQITENLLEVCQMLRGMHDRALRSGNRLWWVTVSPTKADPRQAFRDLLKDFKNVRQNACNLFNDWFVMVDDALLG